MAVSGVTVLPASAPTFVRAAGSAVICAGCGLGPTCESATVVVTAGFWLDTDTGRATAKGAFSVDAGGTCRLTTLVVSAICTGCRLAALLASATGVIAAGFWPDAGRATVKSGF